MNGVDPFNPPVLKDLPAHVTRMQTEVKELGQRLVAISKFVTDQAGEFSQLVHLEQRALINQYDAMQEYHRILSSRYLLELAKRED